MDMKPWQKNHGQVRINAARKAALAARPETRVEMMDSAARDVAAAANRAVSNHVKKGGHGLVIANVKLTQIAFRTPLE